MRLPKMTDNVVRILAVRASAKSDGISPMADGPCQLACTSAYGLCSSRCGLLPHPAAKAICYAACATAYGVCLHGCP